MAATVPDAEWNLDPVLLAALGSYLAIYVVRWRAARREAGARGASVPRLLSFTAGMACLVGALVTPVDALSERLFSAHMAQHILIGDLAAILLLLGLTKVILRPVTARLRRVEESLGLLAHPAVTALVYAGTLWLWHLPALYELGLRTPELHPLQHAAFFAAPLIFWWPLLSPVAGRRRPQGMAIVFYLAVGKVMMGILASVITFSPVVFYDFYAEQPDYWGLTPAADQSIAGAMMMAEQSIVFTVAVVLLFVRMLGDSEREEQRAERYGLDARA